MTLPACVAHYELITLKFYIQSQNLIDEKILTHICEFLQIIQVFCT